MGPHTALLVALPWQPRPPCWGAGESHDRLSVTAPIPQRTGHGVSSAHGPQAPSTAGVGEKQTDKQTNKTKQSENNDK